MRLMRLSSGRFGLAAHLLHSIYWRFVFFRFNFHALLAKKGSLMSSGFDRGRNGKQCRDVFVSFRFPETRYCPGLNALYSGTQTSEPSLYTWANALEAPVFLKSSTSFVSLHLHLHWPHINPRLHSTFLLHRLIFPLYISDSDPNRAERVTTAQGETGKWNRRAREIKREKISTVHLYVVFFFFKEKLKLLFIYFSFPAAASLFFAIFVSSLVLKRSIMNTSQLCVSQPVGQLNLGGAH